MAETFRPDWQRAIEADWFRLADRKQSIFLTGDIATLDCSTGSFLEPLDR